MAIEKVQLSVSVIKELLNNGFTWLKKDDLGFGSIQEKYGANDIQIATIRKHPQLKNLETTAKIFVIIDDTKDAEPAPTAVLEENIPLEQPKVKVKAEFVNVPVEAEEQESFSAFANL